MRESNHPIFNFYATVFLLGFIIAEFCFGPVYTLIGIFCLFAFSLTGIFFAPEKLDYGRDFELQIILAALFASSWFGLMGALLIEVIALLVT